MRKQINLLIDDCLKLLQSSQSHLSSFSLFDTHHILPVAYKTQKKDKVAAFQNTLSMQGGKFEKISQEIQRKQTLFVIQQEEEKKYAINEEEEEERP